MTQHSTQAASPLPSNSLWGRLLKRPWPAQLVLVAALLLAVPFLFHAGSTVHAADNEITGVTLTSLNPGELAITWDAPSRAPTDYRVTWKKSGGKWPSYKNENTALGGNAFPTGTSHTVTGLEEGTAYKVRVRARYFDDGDNLTESGPWSDPPVELTVSAKPSEDSEEGEGDSNEGRSTGPPAKPEDLLAAATHSSVLLIWTDPGDDSITGYQILRGPDAANLAVLTNDTGNASASYTDNTVTVETTYLYAIKARNANGLSPQSKAATANTPAAPVEPEIALAIGGAEFTLAGQDLDTTGTCSETDVNSIVAGCTINIETKVVPFAVDGELDSDDRLIVKTGRDKAAVDAASVSANQDDLRGTDKTLNIAFPEGRSLLRVWGDEDEMGGGEEHFFRVNVLPYWTLSGQRFYKNSDCLATLARSAAEITDDACINTHVGNTAELRFHNVIFEQYNVYVSVNRTEVIMEPNNAALGAPFTLNFQDGDNVVGVRLVSKTAGHPAESFGNSVFYYKVTTNTLVSNHEYHPIVGGKPAFASYAISTTAHRAQLFRTGSHPRGYSLSKITVEMIQPTRTPASAVETALPAFAIYDKDSEIADGNPGRMIVDLSGSVASAGRKIFTPACPTTLDPDTDYYVYFALSYLESGLGLVLKGAGQDENGAPGWSIEDRGLFKGTGRTTFRPSNPGPGLTGVLAIAVSGDAVTQSTDASLRDLVLKDTGEKTIALDPVVTSCTTDYKATVANHVDTITVEPTLSGANATIRYLDNSDMELMDADGSTTDEFDVDLAVGENIFKVKVTAEDGATRTHTVTVTRVDFLVSNAGSIVDEATTDVSTSTPKTGISFTTGSNPVDVSTVRLNLLVPTGTTAKVSIYSDNSGEPGSSLKALANPGTVPTTRAWLDFVADDYRLAANTTYWIVVERGSGSGDITIQTTESTAEDAGTTTRWTIGDDLHALVSNTWTNIVGSRTIPQMVIKGERVKNADATLSAMALTDPSSNNVPLDPTFASSVESYTATVESYTAMVANAVDRITVEPTKNDPYATIVYLDSENAELSDADDNTPEFDFALTDGENVLKVKVTSDDGTTTKTYAVTVTFTRVDVLVSNLGQTVRNYDAVGLARFSRTLTGSAVSFTTGGNTGGYEVSAVRLSVGVVTSATPKVSIYSDNSGSPGTSLKVLTNPTDIPSFTQTQYTNRQVIPEKRDFGADNFKLDAGTKYWIVIERASASGGVLFYYTRSTAEDSGTAPGWSIGGGYDREGSQPWSSATLHGLPMQFAIKGALVATAPGAPASLTATPGNTQATLTWTAPTFDGNSAITKYQYRVSVDGGSTWTPDWTDVPDGSDTGTDLADERTLTITSLANGPLHTFQVRAVNSEGNGDLRQATATPAAGPSTPDAPASLTATPGDAQATLTWTAPTFDGNSAITKYQYRVSVDDGTTWNPDWRDVPDGPDSGSDLADERTLTLTGLEAVILHTFEVRAVNSEGDGGAAQTTATPTAIITLAADFTSIIRELHEVTLTLTRAGSTALAADVTLMVENATGDSVVSTSGQTETLTFQVGDDTVEFAVPLFWIRSSRPTGSFVATVEAGAEYDVSGATATVEVVHPTGTLINVSLDQNRYDVTEGDDLTYNVVFNVLEEIAAPNKDITVANLISLSGTAQSPDDYIGISQLVEVAAASWTLVANHYLATVALTLETKDDALYERPMGSDESLEINLEGTGGTPSWVTHKGPTMGTTRYPITILDNETLTLNAELSSTGLTAGASLRIDEDAGQDVTLTVTNSDLASDGNPVTLPPGVKLKITPDIPTNRGATETDDWTISPDEIDLGGTATITIIDDMLEEGPESVTFKVGFDDDEMFQSARATLTINDDEYTGPVLQSAAINGRELTLEFSNTLDATSRPARSAFEVKVRGTAVSLSSSNPVSISGSTVTLRLRSSVTAGDTVTVSYTAPGANPIKDDAALEAPSFTEEPVTNNTPNAPATGKPVISGTPQRDETLTVSTSGIRDDDGLSNPNFRYQWVRVEGATETSLSSGASYLLTRDDIGKQIKVIVAFRDDAGKFERVDSDLFPRSGTIQNKPNRQPTGRPTLSGTYQVGHTLSADTSGIDDPDGLTNPGYTYQWQRWESGVYTDISGADSIVYTLTADDQGKRVQVQVTFTDDDDNSHTLESFLTRLVQAQTSLPSDKVKVSLDATAYVVEEGDTVQVTVTLAEAPDEGPVYIGFTLTPGNGATPADFTAGSTFTRQLRFDAGETTDRINIRADDDTLNDDGETITLCLDDLPDPYATLAGLNCATVNILDNDDPNSVQVSFDRGNYWASEDGNPAWPRISVHPVPDRKITIPITITRGGGLSAADHGAVTTRVTFGPSQYGVHGDGHLSDNRTYASFPIEIWAIDDRHDDDDEYLDLAFGALPPFVTKDTGYRLGGDSRAGFRRPADQSRVWFNDNEFTEVEVTDSTNHALTRQMRVTFADAELEAKEGLYEIGTVATVRVQLSRPRNKESTVTIPITVTRHGTATAADYARADIPSSITFLPGQTEYSFRVRAVNDDIDDDDEYLTLSFGRLPNLVYAGDQATVRVNLVDNDDPPVEVSFEHANYEVTSTQREGNSVSARLQVKVKLSAAPERFVDVGIVAESTQGGGRIHLGSSPYIPRGPHSGAAFDADETEFTVTVVMSATDGFDPNQTYQLSFEGMSDRVSVGSPAMAIITINANP